MSQTIERVLADAVATECLGGDLAAALTGGCVIHLAGDLGAGKTTLARGLLRGLGYSGSVKSPTYTLMEPYETPSRPVLHLDLYRLADPEELEYLGLRDALSPQTLVVAEWPEQGAGFLPAADLRIHLIYAGEGRVAHIQALSDIGQRMLDRLSGGTSA